MLSFCLHSVSPELKATFNLDLLGVKKNPQSAMYTSLGVITKGTVIEVNVAELGLVTTTGKVVWGKCSPTSLTHLLTLSLTLTHSLALSLSLSLSLSLFRSDGLSFALSRFPSCTHPAVTLPGKYAQVTNNPENDGCINAVLLV